ncbi:MAG: hypothetical protein WCT51_03850 [Candidatus Shapirobacteria bacterium]|jgi:hypothetical protein
MAKNIIFGLLFIFTGYVSGRIGHLIGGTSLSPHHWIYGLIIMIIGFILHRKYHKLYFLIGFFGIGVFISDLNDFLNLQFYGVDTVSKFTFWNID